MPAFTNDDLRNLGAFEQAQGSTNDQLRLLRSVANRIGLYDAADAITQMIIDDTMSNRIGINHERGAISEIAGFHETDV